MKKLLFSWLFILFIVQIVFSQIPRNYFIKNIGQWRSDIRYALFSNNLTLFATNNALFFDYFTIANENSQVIKSGNVVKFQIDNANFNNFIEIGESSWQLNFFYGNNPSKWYKNIRGVEKIIISNILPNVDLRLSVGSEPRYDFIVRAGGDPRNIKIKIEGATIVECSQEEIVLKTSFGKLIHRNLFVYQMSENTIQKVEASFHFVDQNTFAFSIQNFDKQKDLIIDPLVLSTLIGGSGTDEIVDIAETEPGTIIVTGWTESFNFPTKPGSYSNTYSGGKDIFISKFNIKGSARELVYSTFLGGAENDVPVNVLVDQNKNIYIGATTNSSDLPLVNSLSKSSYGQSDAYICKFNPDCNEIIFSTYFGGSKNDILTSAKLAKDNGIFLTGYTNSNNLPVTGGAYQNNLKGKNDIFFAKISNTGQTVRTCTYIGGNEDDFSYTMCVTPSEYVYIGGATKSSDFPVHPVKVWYSGSYEYVFESPFDRTYNGNFDGVVIKIFGTSGAVEYISFFGGFADDFVTAVGYFGTDEKVVFAGKTFKEPSTTTFPLTQNAYQNSIKGQEEAFVASLSNINITSQYGWTYKSQDLVFSTFLGGSGTDVPTAITFNNNTKTFYIVGYTTSTNFPIVNNPSGKKLLKNDIFFVSLLNDGSSIQYSNILGGNGDDFPTAICLNYNGDYYIVGRTTSSNFPIVNPIDGLNGGTLPDAFILKNVDANLRIESPYGGEEFCPGKNLTIKWYVEGMAIPDSFNVEIYPESLNQWQMVAPNIKGLSTTITLPTNITGNVWIRVSHPRGLIASIQSPVVVLEPPKLLSFNPDQDSFELCEGDSINFAVQATGSKLNYQWFHDGKSISNANDTVLWLKNLQISNSGKYKVVISGTCPPSVESKEVSISIVPKTQIICQSNDTTVKIGNKLSLYIQSKGQNLKYQWFKNDIKLLGETKNTFEITSVSRFDEGTYYCIVAGTCGSDTSNKITVLIDTNIAQVNKFEPINEIDVKVIDNTLNIKIPRLQGNINASIFIYNILGANVFFENLVADGSQNEFRYDISFLPSGPYLLNIRIGELNKNEVFIKY
ncbi:MAG: immunoglobulin domain-containing protein [Candidatus Kapaibacteriota bacterium]